MKVRPLCPHCGIPVDIAKLPHEGLFASYRKCLNCENYFQVDPDTKRRQGVSIVLALVSLILTLLLYFRGNDWLIPAGISYASIAVFIYLANKKVYLVPADPER